MATITSSSASAWPPLATTTTTITSNAPPPTTAMQALRTTARETRASFRDLKRRLSIRLTPKSDSCPPIPESDIPARGRRKRHSILHTKPRNKNAGNKRKPSHSHLTSSPPPAPSSAPRARVDCNTLAASADPQLQSPLFSRLSYDVRLLIYEYVWADAGVDQHIVQTRIGSAPARPRPSRHASGNRELTHFACMRCWDYLDSDPEVEREDLGGESTVVRRRRTDDQDDENVTVSTGERRGRRRAGTRGPNLTEPYWGARNEFMRPWCPHWECDSVAVGSSGFDDYLLSSTSSSLESSAGTEGSTGTVTSTATTATTTTTASSPANHEAALTTDGTTTTEAPVKAESQQSQQQQQGQGQGQVFKKKPSSPFLPLLLSCKSLYLESIPSLYNTLRFCFMDYFHLEAFLRLVPLEHLRNIRSLHLCECVSANLFMCHSALRWTAVWSYMPLLEQLQELHVWLYPSWVGVGRGRVEGGGWLPEDDLLGIMYHVRSRGEFVVEIPRARGDVELEGEEEVGDGEGVDVGEGEGCGQHKGAPFKLRRPVVEFVGQRARGRAGDLWDIPGLMD